MVVRTAKQSSKKNKSANPKKYVDLGHQHGTFSEDSEAQTGLITDNFYRDWCKENNINPDTASRANYLDVVALTSSFMAIASEELDEDVYASVMAKARAETFDEELEEDTLEIDDE